MQEGNWPRGFSFIPGKAHTARRAVGPSLFGSSPPGLGPVSMKPRVVNGGGQCVSQLLVLRPTKLTIQQQRQRLHLNTLDSKRPKVFAKRQDCS